MQFLFSLYVFLFLLYSSETSQKRRTLHILCSSSFFVVPVNIIIFWSNSQQHLHSFHPLKPALQVSDLSIAPFAVSQTWIVPVGTFSIFTTPGTPVVIHSSTFQFVPSPRFPNTHPCSSLPPNFVWSPVPCWPYMTQKRIPNNSLRVPPLPVPSVLIDVFHDHQMSCNVNGFFKYFR